MAFKMKHLFGPAITITIFLFTAAAFGFLYLYSVPDWVQPMNHSSDIVIAEEFRFRPVPNYSYIVNAPGHSIHRGADKAFTGILNEETVEIEWNRPLTDISEQVGYASAASLQTGELYGHPAVNETIITSALHTGNQVFEVFNYEIAFANGYRLELRPDGDVLSDSVAVITYAEPDEERRRLPKAKPASKKTAAPKKPADSPSKTGLEKHPRAKPAAPIAKSGSKSKAKLAPKKAPAEVVHKLDLPGQQAEQCPNVSPETIDAFVKAFEGKCELQGQELDDEFKKIKLTLSEMSRKGIPADVSTLANLFFKNSPRCKKTWVDLIKFAARSIRSRRKLLEPLTCTVLGFLLFSIGPMIWAALYWDHRRWEKANGYD